ncbi:MAG TPA: hypothetical protein VM370_07795 [Candidatus Thermoplasmatota archaeon]|nr:hypothetical protein [Candidatus Thermoplasmatota archaeon]
MTATMAQSATHPEDVRKQSAHVLAGLVGLQGLAALGCFGYVVLAQGRDPLDGMSLYYLLVAVLSFLTSGLEWARARPAEMVATFAILLSFGLTLASVLAGLWYLVPFVGLTTIAAIFALVDRFAVRDESRHRPMH